MQTGENFGDDCLRFERAFFCCLLMMLLLLLLLLLLLMMYSEKLTVLVGDSLFAMNVERF